MHVLLNIDFMILLPSCTANRRLRRNRDNLLPSSSQSGRVYFSDVSELRAAAREMQGFRIASNVFRNTGFGTTQTISHLRCTIYYLILVEGGI